MVRGHLGQPGNDIGWKIFYTLGFTWAGQQQFIYAFTIGSFVGSEMEMKGLTIYRLDKPKWLISRDKLLTGLLTLIKQY